MPSDLELTSDGHVVIHVSGYYFKPVFDDGRESFARVGMGIYWANHHPNNRSIRLLGRRASKDQAEIWATLTALRQAASRGHTSVVIRTENQLIARAISDWMPRWKATGWRTSDDKPVRNRHDFEALDQAMSYLDQVVIQISGPSHPQAEQARLLANKAAEKRVPKINNQSSAPPRNTHHYQRY